MNGEPNFSNRKYIIGGIAFCITVVYILRLLSLQIMSDDYKKNADSNAFRKEIQYPSRGLIMDRKGRLLVYNESSYNIMVVMNEQRGIDTLDFCQTVGITRDHYIRRMDEIKAICERHGALLIEDAAEAMGACIDGRQCGSFGDYAAISYNGNKIITGSAGGCLLTNSLEDANRARKWATQARENAAWYQHEEVGYNYRMSNVVAGVIRGQYLHLEEHIAQKKAVYERYLKGLEGLPVRMNPITEGTTPNYWLSALIIDDDAMCRQVRDDHQALYIPEAGRSCPTEILEAITSVNAEGRPIWKPMHMQPMYRMHEAVGREGTLRCRTNAYIDGGCLDVGMDIFERGLCLPSDNKMTAEEQDRIIEVIRACFE